MATNLLTNVVESKTCTATATDEKYTYAVNYEIVDNGKTLKSLNINVANKSTGAPSGNMSYRDNSKNVSAPDGVDAKILLTVLDSILAEIKAGLIA